MSQVALLMFLLLQPPRPAAAGVYYQPGGADWLQLQPAPITEMKLKGMELFNATDGFTSLGTKVVCRGSKAALRIAFSKPVFFIRETGSSQDALIVRLAQSKDNRTVHASTADITVGNKGGFNKGDIRKVVVTEYPDRSFSVEPLDDLGPGEYLLVFGSTNSGFDFGIDKKK
jgi:hypothetical protein